MKEIAPDRKKKVHLYRAVLIRTVLSIVFSSTLLYVALCKNISPYYSHTSSIQVKGLRRVMGPLIYCTVVTGAKAKKTLI